MWVAVLHQCRQRNAVTDLSSAAGAAVNRQLCTAGCVEDSQQQRYIHAHLVQ